MKDFIVIGQALILVGVIITLIIAYYYVENKFMSKVLKKEKVWKADLWKVKHREAFKPLFSESYFEYYLEYTLDLSEKKPLFKHCSTQFYEIGEEIDFGQYEWRPINPPPTK